MEITVTLVLVVVTVAISIWGWNNSSIMGRWIFNPYSTHHHREYYRMIASGFLHKDYIHLIFNMFVLFMFGNYVEQTLDVYFGPVTGKILFLALYLLGIIISDIPTLIKHKDHRHYNALGASGGVSSVLFSFVILYPLEELCLYGIPLLCFPGILWAALYVIYSIYMGKKGGDNINHDAHLYGGLFGIVFTFIVVPNAFEGFFAQLAEFSLF
jgi:membrane associated rhomboid family serine protease